MHGWPVITDYVMTVMTLYTRIIETAASTFTRFCSNWPATVLQWGGVKKYWFPWPWINNYLQVSLRQKPLPSELLLRMKAGKCQ